MQSTLVKHNKFFKAGHATSFDTAKKYAISCAEASSEYARVVTPNLITTGDFSITTDISSVTGSLELAGSDDNWYFGFDGGTRYSGIDIDQIAFFNTAFDSLDAVTTALKLVNGFEIGNILGNIPICYYKCNEGTGVEVANDGSESIVMALSNTPTWITDGMI